ncbi:MAG: TIGR03557 family F420-dependent LLM class oxidoreductase [Dehalococcoidia bacterium]
MIELGYTLSSEEFPPLELVKHARMAEDAGFTFALISDHYHPWVDSQGHSPFVWSTIGGVAASTERIRIGTGVTCPTMRIHPAIIAQAAATCAAMLPGRFFLGVGTGENLNEHITGERWPSANVRREMLEEAVWIIRKLWSGENVDHEGSFYQVVDARIYTLPDPLPEIYVAASGEHAAELAGEIGDGLIGVAPAKNVVQAFEAAGGRGKPKYGQLTVCWAKDEASARKTAYEIWPNAGITGELSAELPLPRHFEQASKMVSADDVAKDVVCGPDPQKHIEQIRKYANAGFDHVYVHQVGPDQQGFIDFYQREVVPQLGDLLVERQRKRRVA